MNSKEQKRLRDLACKYAEYAHSEPMRQRREKWRLHNGLKEKTYPFHIEDNGSWYADLTPPLECESDECRALEKRLLQGIVGYETIDDDRIIPERFLVDWAVSLTPICDELEFTRADHGHGSNLGYHTSKPIKDIDSDFAKLKKRIPALDRERSERNAEIAREAFDGLLAVEIGRAGSMYSDGFTNKAVLLMGMQELYTEMSMNPDAVHRFLNFFVEDNMALGQWEEDQGLLTLNHDGNQGYCSGSSQYSDETTTVAGQHVATTDRFGYLESQESAGLSAAMFEEFVMPHLERLAGKFKLMKYGCCEPVHHFMPLLGRLHGLRKVSVTPWCDIQLLSENCPENIIWSRKPVPLTLCGETFDPDAMRAHLQETLDIGQDYFIEFVFRDTCLLTGEMRDRVNQTCSIVREVTGHSEGAK